MFKNTLRNFLIEDFPVSCLSNLLLGNFMYFLFICLGNIAHRPLLAEETVPTSDRETLPIAHCSPRKHCLPATVNMEHMHIGVGGRRPTGNGGFGGAKPPPIAQGKRVGRRRFPIVQAPVPSRSGIKYPVRGKPLTPM